MFGALSILNGLRIYGVQQAKPIDSLDRGEHFVDSIRASASKSRFERLIFSYGCRDIKSTTNGVSVTPAVKSCNAPPRWP